MTRKNILSEIQDVQNYITEAVREGTVTPGMYEHLELLKGELAKFDEQFNMTTHAGFFSILVLTHHHLLMIVDPNSSQNAEPGFPTHR